jgi:hypothetical protein
MPEPFRPLENDLEPASARAGAGRAFGRRVARVGRLGAPLAALLGVFLVAGASYELSGHGPPFRDAPPARYTGGFGEPTCVSCHFEGQLNQSPGSVALVGLPEQYEAGKTYPVTVTLTRPGMKIAGFELSARFESGGQAGTLEVLPEDKDQIGVTTERDVQYVHHLRPGTSRVVADTSRWTVRWTAPTTSGTVLLNVVGNAADSDDSQAGDFIFSAEVRTRPQSR